MGETEPEGFFEKLNFCGWRDDLVVRWLGIFDMGRCRCGGFLSI